MDLVETINKIDDLACEYTGQTLSDDLCDIGELCEDLKQGESIQVIEFAAKSQKALGEIAKEEKELKPEYFDQVSDAVVYAVEDDDFVKAAAYCLLADRFVTGEAG